MSETVNQIAARAIEPNEATADEQIALTLRRADLQYIAKLTQSRAVDLFNEAARKPALGECPPEMDDLVRIRRAILHALDPQLPPPRN